MRTTAAPADTLFDEPEPARPAAAPARDLAPASARLVTTSSPDMNDPERRPLLLLVVDCPYCDHQHIHPAGRTGEPRFGKRRLRCVGTQGGDYHFPVVDQ
ncbi:hypothetical protein ACWGDX_24025 [Streptomyces sp. NPDC055025]